MSDKIKKLKFKLKDGNAIIEFSSLHQRNANGYLKHLVNDSKKWEQLTTKQPQADSISKFKEWCKNEVLYPDDILRFIEDFQSELQPKNDEVKPRGYDMDGSCMGGNTYPEKVVTDEEKIVIGLVKQTKLAAEMLEKVKKLQLQQPKQIDWDEERELWLKQVLDLKSKVTMLRKALKDKSQPKQPKDKSNESK